MATQIVIANNETITVDDTMLINWVDKGKDWNDAWLPNTIHYVIWNTHVGQNEVQNKDPSTGDMTGNVALNSTSDAVGTTTVADLLTWADTRLQQIRSAEIDYGNAHENAQTKWVDDGNDLNDFNAGNSATASYFDFTKSWRDYDEDYS